MIDILVLPINYECLNILEFGLRTWCESEK